MSVLNSSLLLVKGISKHFGANLALDDASFSVQEGEVLGLIGPNGAGKTTLFECLAGLMPTDSGQVIFRDQLLALAHRKDAFFYLPDGIRPWADQTVRWALSFFQRLYGRTEQEASALVGSLQLKDLMKSRIGTLSKGEAKRTLLALGLLTPHPLLLLDEPFDGLDLRQTREVMTLLQSCPAQGRTLFLSIHQLTDAARVCDRLVLLSAGQVVGEGTLTELQAKAGLSEGGLEEVFLALT
jgi:ABC-type multidrug transport system ATPase subunit